MGSSPLFLCVFFGFFFRSFFWVGEGVIIAAAPIILFFTPYPKIYLFLAFQVTKRETYFFFWPLI